jgi:hypothetical protein
MMNRRTLGRMAIAIALIIPAAGAKHALLVGVSEYPSLDRSQWLMGPVNDVELAQEVLTGPRFQFPKENISTLVGWPKKEEDRPTRANIQKAFQELATRVSKDDLVFILMSGHGSQQPANEDPNDIETDGLDEIFLPADTTTWDPVTQTVRGAIVDDEIKTWTNAIRDKGAIVWIIFDSCHSGTMTRGTGNSHRVNRRIDPALLIPKDAVVKNPATKALPKAEVESDLATTKEEPKERGTLIAMYAAQSLEPTFEMPMPPPLGPRRGLFTTTILDIISNAPGALSYRDLAETIDVIYRSNGILQPTPLIEGNGIDLPVMGIGQAPPRMDVLFTGDFDPAQGYKINAGHLQGVNVGAVLEVFPAAISNSSKSLGTVKVTSAGATSAFVKPGEFAKHKAAKVEDLGGACRAEVIYSEMGLAKMTVVIQEKNKDGEWAALSPDTKSEAGEFIQSLTVHAKGLYTIGTDSVKADWFLQIEGGKVTSLVPASGYSEVYGTQSINAPDVQTLAKDLGRIARARQLLQIAGTSPRGGGLKLDVEVVRFDPPGSKEGKVVPYDSGGRNLKAGDEIAFRIVNDSNLSIDVTLLHVDDRFAITPVFPEPGTVDDNRIPAKETFVTPRLTVSSEKPIQEQLVVLAVRSTRERQDFTCLEQSSLETTRSVPALQSPLGKLLSSRIYGGESTRGLQRAETGSYATRLLTWTAHPAK